jgi:hypothetical protein
MVDPTPVLPHITGEFYNWLWWSSEKQEGVFDLGEDIGRIDVWMDERLAFRSPSEARITAVITGENPSETLEARAALAGGKVLQELRVGLRRDDREFRVTLKGPTMDFASARMPQVVDSEEDAAIYDRMFLYEELGFLLSGLFRQFCELRTSLEWDETVEPAMRSWAIGGE